MGVTNGVLKAKARTNKAFKLDDNKWYEVSGEAEKVLIAMEKPYPEVEVTYEQQGYKRKVTFIKVVGAGQPSKTEFKKDMPEEKETVATGSSSKPAYSYKKKQEEAKPTQEYWDKKDIAIKKGNALNAAAYALSGTEPDIEVLEEKVKYLANKFYEYLTIEE